ncbi:hypothetical protein Sjap_009775 [Stephania japonica]|uniref:DUF241 domain protein n=1 Tax=Stephania japonica TaxID=461633 RepID=A0AAP0JAH4_9MAGN
MATSPLRFIKTSHHARSISLPSRSNPLALEVQQQLCRLRSSQETSTSSTSSLLCQKLASLKDLYHRIDELVQLPHTQQAHSHVRLEACVNEVLDESMTVLDLCSTSRDVLLEIQESTQVLLSSLHRKRGADQASLANDVKEYMACNVKGKKAIQKSIGSLKRMESKYLQLLALERDENLVSIIGILGEARAISVDIFEALLSSVSRTRKQLKQSGSWSLVAKLMNSRRVGSQVYDEAEISEMEKVDIALSTLITNKSLKANAVLDAQNALEHLEALDLRIQGFVEGLDCVFRSLIKIRVSFLNILNCQLSSLKLIAKQFCVHKISST